MGRQKNGTWDGSGDPAAGTGEDASWTDDTGVSPMLMGYSGQGVDCVFNFGQDGTFNGNQTAQGNSDANGVGDFYYSPPTGFLAMATSNIAEPAIGPNSDTTSDQNFNTVLYTGNSGTNAITGVGFQPDFVWAKSRTTAYPPELYDVVRGSNRMYSSATTADAAGSITSFDSDGFTHQSGSIGTNASGDSLVAWNWKGGGTAASNTDGTNITSSVSANPDAGFSIVSWTGTGVGSDSVGHGLTQKPDMVICKARTSAGSNYWHVNHKDLTASDYNIFSTPFTSAETDVNTNYSEGGIGLGDENVIDFVAGYSGANNVANCNNSGSNFIAYCFHSVEGFSKVGSYEGNSSANGPFVYLGFRPAWIMLKKIDSTAYNWNIHDTTRDTINPDETSLFADSSVVENGVGSAGDWRVDMLSNGFKLRENTNYINQSGKTVIYLAFAEAPFKYANAR